MTLGSYFVNFRPFDLIFGPLWGFSVKIVFCNWSQFGADKNFEPIKKLPNFPIKVKPRCERVDPVDKTGKPGWGGKDSSMDSSCVHWCCQVLEDTPVFPLDKDKDKINEIKT